MEEVTWVTTPPCRLCVPRPEFRRRIGCMGCEKLRPRPAHQTVRRRRAALTVRQREKRDGQIALLRAQGLSYGEIAARLSMARSTVQSVLERGTTRHCAQKEGERRFACQSEKGDDGETEKMDKAGRCTGGGNIF